MEWLCVNERHKLPLHKSRSRPGAFASSWRAGSDQERLDRGFCSFGFVLIPLSGWGFEKYRHSWEAQVLPPDVSVNIDCLESIMKSQDPLTGTGPWFFRPDFAAAFFKGVFIAEEAKEAPVLFKKLGPLYLTAKMPPWMRLKLGGSALTPISKEQFTIGDDPDARPVKAEDFDTSAWTKPWLARLHYPSATLFSPSSSGSASRVVWRPRAGAEALV